MLTLRASVTPADRAADPYFYLPFDVPEGTTRIDATLAYPKAADCVIDLGCLDPRVGPWPAREGFRGWSGGARDGFFVATDDATPGYVHGPIPPGRWQVILGLYKLPPAGAEVTVTVAFDASPRATLPQPERTFPVRAGEGWYKGDLHSHTFHSDARGAPELLHAAARQAGLDFLAVTDHNTTTGRRYFHPRARPSSSSSAASRSPPPPATPTSTASTTGSTSAWRSPPTRTPWRGSSTRGAGSSRSTTTSRPSPGTTSSPTPTAWRSGSRPGRSGTGSRSRDGRNGWLPAAASPPSAAATSISPTASSPRDRSASAAPPPSSGSPSSPRTPSSPP